MAYSAVVSIGVGKYAHCDTTNKKKKLPNENYVGIRINSSCVINWFGPGSHLAMSKVGSC